MKADYIFVPHTKTGKRLHRVVAEFAVGRKLCYNECVHHINCDKLDNRKDNLVVMSRSQHSREHAKEYWDKKTKQEKRLLTKKLVAASAVARQKPVICIDKNNTVVRRFDSIKDTVAFGFIAQHVCQCCKGQRKTHKGYYWKYA